MGSLIAVGNLKGGTGKSTIAVNVACALVQDGCDVALIDADGQGTATDWRPQAAGPGRVLAAWQRAGCAKVGRACARSKALR